MKQCTPMKAKTRPGAKPPSPVKQSVLKKKGK